MADTHTIGAFEAKTHFSKLLERVGAGEHITITKHGVPVAKLVPATNRDPAAVRTAIEELKVFAKEGGYTLGGVTLRSLRDEGRR